MKLYSENKDYKLYHGSMLDMLDVIEPNSIDAIITDPPYELNFMNKGWDNSGIAFQKDTWEKCYQALKSGGYLLAFGGSRTFHRIACAIEDAVFEIRDTIMWLYGSGFPKSMNIGLAIDKKNGVDNRTGNIKTDGKATNSGSGCYNCNNGKDNSMKQEYEERKAQNEWDGWGTCLKPAYEPIIVARKPVENSIIDNVMKYGVGGINIDECRVCLNGEKNPKGSGNICNSGIEQKWGFKGNGGNETSSLGRFPANVIHDGSNEAISGMLDSYEDEGSASRYFYCAKASVKDREEGLEDFEKQRVYDGDHNYGYANTENDNLGDRIANVKRANVHPTVKPTELMQYLVRLVSPKGATILDCFNGSGSTGKAVMFENKERNAGYKYIGIELTEEYLPISKARIEYVCNHDFYFSKNDIGRIQHEEIKKSNGVFDIYDFIGEEK